MTIDNPLQPINFFLALVGTGVFGLVVYKKPRTWLYIVAPVLFLVHNVIRYPVIWAPNNMGLSAYQVNAWSTVIILQGIITLVGCGLIILHELMVIVGFKS